MKINNVHRREIGAPAGRVGALIDGLGSDDDRLWPAELWPTTPFELDGPLAVGTRGRQGQIRQAVEDYAPGRRVVLRFAPGLGLVGTHRLEVEALGADRSRLTHTLDCRVEAKLLPVYPILIRQHDALVEDLFDRAELATIGRLARPSRRPASVRIANALELRLSRRLRRTSPKRSAAERAGGALVPGTLAALAALHAAWALGSHWPAASDRELAERVLASAERDRLGGDGIPPPPATAAVALALLAASVSVRAAAAGSRSRGVRGSAWAVSGIFLLRGTLGGVSALAGGLDETYERLDLALYSPLCLALGGGTAWLLTRDSSACPT